jgi:hypothetical protein
MKDALNRELSFFPSTFFLQYFEQQDEKNWKIKIEDEETSKQNFYFTTNSYCMHQLLYSTKSILTPLHTPIHNVCVIYTKLVPNFFKNFKYKRCTDISLLLKYIYHDQTTTYAKFLILNQHWWSTC